MTTYWGLGSCGRREGSVDQGTFLRIRPSLSISMETPKTGDLVIGLVGHHWYKFYWEFNCPRDLHCDCQNQGLFFVLSKFILIGIFEASSPYL